MKQFNLNQINLVIWSIKDIKQQKIKYNKMIMVLHQYPTIFQIQEMEQLT